MIFSNLPKGTRWAAPICLLLFAILCRFQLFGNPLPDIDEQFYLFTGGRILRGDLPYVDIWDRKPLGLFLLYAFFHLFGPWRLWAYQIGATLSVWGTSLLVAGSARAIAPRAGAFLAALLYIAYPGLSAGYGGQSPVFYNLLVAAAMNLILQRVILPADGVRNIRSAGLMAMALFGLAMEIKQSSVFEGVFLGLFLIWFGWKSRRPAATLTADAFLWVLTALAPTLCVMTFYVLLGYGHEWFFANIESIFLRAPHPAWLNHMNFRHMLWRLLPLLIADGAALFCLRAAVKRIPLLFLTLWAASALAGVFLFGDWYDHYALPLYVPLTILAAPLGNPKTGRLFLIVLLAAVTVISEQTLRKHIQVHGDVRLFSDLQRVLSHPPGCVFVYQGPVAVYDFISWCPLTTHPFPGHFNQQIESNATGMDSLEELNRIFRTPPRYVITQTSPRIDENMAVYDRLEEILHADYHEVYRYVPPVRHHALTRTGQLILVVYARNEQAAPSPPDGHREP